MVMSGVYNWAARSILEEADIDFDMDDEAQVEVELRNLLTTMGEMRELIKERRGGAPLAPMPQLQDFNLKELIAEMYRVIGV